MTRDEMIKELKTKGRELIREQWILAIMFGFYALLIIAVIGAVITLIVYLVNDYPLMQTLDDCFWILDAKIYCWR